MCTISDKLKLCTCATTNVRSLKHYWILQRPTDGDTFIEGEIMPAANIGEEVSKLNVNTLSKVLNDATCFDVELKHEENDTLVLYFSCRLTPEVPNNFAGGDYLAYAFKYKKGKWRKTEYDPFANNKAEVQAGKTTQPFVKRAD